MTTLQVSDLRAELLRATDDCREPDAGHPTTRSLGTLLHRLFAGLVGDDDAGAALVGTHHVVVKRGRVLQRCRRQVYSVLAEAEGSAKVWCQKVRGEHIVIGRRHKYTFGLAGGAG